MTFLVILTILLFFAAGLCWAAMIYFCLRAMAHAKRPGALMVLFDIKAFSFESHAIETFEPAALPILRRARMAFAGMLLCGLPVLGILWAAL